MKTKTISLYFQVHQPIRLKQYRFFDIGNNDYYYDDYLNESIINRVATNCYLPANKILLKKLKQHEGKFRVAFSLSGVLIDQLKLYTPEVLESFKELAQTGMVEFLSETYSHSLISLQNKDAFLSEVKKHSDLIKSTFGLKPTTFRNTELIYSDSIGESISQLGFKTILTEGVERILKWRSPNYVYQHPTVPDVRLLLRNHKLSDDIGFKFGDIKWEEWPLTSSKYVKWIRESDQCDVINIGLDYESFGEHQKAHSGIFKFLEELPDEALNYGDIRFSLPSEVANENKPKADFSAPDPVSWADQERDTSAWLGNEMQKEAFNKLYALSEKTERCDDIKLKKDWGYLQTSDHFYYMATKFFSDGEVHAYFNPFNTPYEAFINYMNVLNDFKIRLERSIKNKKIKANVPIEDILKDIIGNNKIDRRSLKEALSKMQEDLEKPATKKEHSFG